MNEKKAIHRLFDVTAVDGNGREHELKVTVADAGTGPEAVRITRVIKGGKA